MHIHDIDGLNNLGVNHILVETLVNWWTLIENTVISNMIRYVCVWHMVHMKLIVLVNVYIFVSLYLYYIVLKEGTRIAQTDGGRWGIAIFMWYSFGRRDPYYTGGWEKMGYCYIYIICYWRKGLVLHKWSTKTMLRYTYNDVILCVWWVFDTG